MKKNFKLCFLLISQAILLTSCSVSGVKLIEKVNVTAESKNFEHAGYEFEASEEFMYAKENIAGKDKLDESGTIVVEINKGEKVKVIGKEPSNKYFLIQHLGQHVYVDASSLSKEEINFTPVEEVSDEIKEQLSNAITIANSLEKDKYSEESLNVVYDAVEKTKGLNTEQDYKDAIDTITKAIENLEEINKPDTTKEEVSEKEEETEETQEVEEIQETEEAEDIEEVSLGIEYPAAPDDMDILDGVTFAILKDTKASTIIPTKIYDSSVVGGKEIGTLEKGDEVKVLAIGTNDFARIEAKNGKVGFVKSNTLKKLGD